MSDPLVNTKEGKYKSPKGFHRHQCAQCKHIWEHSDKCFGRKRPHKCPNCKEEEWYKYNGSKPPTLLDRPKAP